MIPARRSRDAGFSLVEVLATVVIMGISFVVFVGGMGTAIVGSDHQRKLAVTQASIRNFAEAIKAATYQDCATVGTYGGAYSPTPPDRLAASATLTNTSSHVAPSVDPLPPGGAILYFYGVAADTSMSLPSGTGFGWTQTSANPDPTKRVTASLDDELWTSDANTPARTSNSGVVTSSVTQTVMLPKAGAVTRRGALGGAATGTTSFSLTPPSGTSRGDAMVAQIVLRGGPATTVTEPPGWVLVSERSNGSLLRSLIFQRTASAQETAPYTWGFSESNDTAGGIASYVGVTSGFAADIKELTYWDGSSFGTTCPTPDAGLQKIKLKVTSNAGTATAIVYIVKRRA